MFPKVNNYAPLRLPEASIFFFGTTRTGDDHGEFECLTNLFDNVLEICDFAFRGTDKIAILVLRHSVYEMFNFISKT